MAKRIRKNHVTRKMTKAEGKAWARRWRLVNKREIEELRRTPMEVKLLQLALLMDSADEFGWETNREEEVNEVRERWKKLRQAYGH